MTLNFSFAFSFVPDLVTGDFDSIREEVKNFMEEKVNTFSKHLTQGFAVIPWHGPLLPQVIRMNV